MPKYAVTFIVAGTITHIVESTSEWGAVEVAEQERECIDRCPCCGMEVEEIEDGAIVEEVH